MHIKGYFNIFKTIKQETAVTRILESEQTKIKNKPMKYIYAIFLFLFINTISIAIVQGQCANDVIPPVANCKIALTVYLDSMGAVEVQATDIDDNSSDNCGIETYEINGNPSITLNCTNLTSPVPVQLVVIDSTGNSDTCNSFILVVDNLAPIATCAPIGSVSVPLNALGTAVFPVAQAIVGSSDNCSVISTLVNDEIAPILTCEDVGVYPYVVKMEDSSGNIGWCQSQIEVTWGAACGFAAQLDSLGRTQCDTGTCTGYASLSSNGGSGTVSYLWEDGSTAVVRNNLCVGEYVVIATDLLGTVDTLVFRIRFEADCVWPGDTDNNSRANNFDLLPIALAYGTPGGARANASNTWAGQTSNNWNIPFALAGLPNYKHIDCNGDAIIDSFDVNAIRLNYAQRYWRNAPVATTVFGSHSQDPPIYVDCDTINQGDSIHCMGVNLGDATTEAVDAYAIAFTINYDPIVVQSATITYGSSWLGAANELISVEKDYTTQGKLETAVGRTDKVSLTGDGRIGTVCFTIRDDILRVSQPDTVTMPITIDAVRFVDEKGNEKPTEPKEGCLSIAEVLSATQTVKTKNDINLYPNPTTGWVRISGLENSLQKITIRTITGELLLTKTIEGKNTLDLDLSSLPEAVYLVSIETLDQIINKRLLIVKG